MMNNFDKIQKAVAVALYEFNGEAYDAEIIELVSHRVEQALPYFEKGMMGAFVDALEGSSAYVGVDFDEDELNSYVFLLEEQLEAAGVIAYP